MLIATGKDDGANLVTCQIAKQRFGVTTTISIVNRSDHVDLFNLLGVDVVVDVPDLILNQIQEGFTSQGITHLKPLPSDGTERSLVSIHVPAAYGPEGTPARRLSLPRRDASVSRNHSRRCSPATQWGFQGESRRRNHSRYDRAGRGRIARPACVTSEAHFGSDYAFYMYMLPEKIEEGPCRIKHQST